MMARISIVLISIMFVMYTCTIDLGVKKCESDLDCPPDKVCSSMGICVLPEDNGSEDAGADVNGDGGIRDTFNGDVEDILDYGHDVGDVRDDTGDVVIDIGDTGKDVGWDINDIYDAGADVKDIQDVSDISDVCVPDCDNKGCGSDGCGGDCGSCGNNSTCSNGECVCSSGYGNCNYDKTDGCEVNFSSIDSCGNSCDTTVKCSSNNGYNPVCDNGVCRLTCNAGYVDCNAQSGKSDGCETKVDADIIWKKIFAGIMWDQVNDIYVDGNGDIYIVGYYTSPEIQFDSIALTNEDNYENGFLAKLSNSGTVLWAKAIKAIKKEGGHTHNVMINSVITDSFNNVYVSGSFIGSLTMDGHNYDSDDYDHDDILILKFDKDGKFLWGKSFGTTYTDKNVFLGIDPSDNSIYLTGYLGGPGADFGGGTLNNGGVFLAKFDSAGKHQWSKDFGGLSSSTFIAIDSKHSIIITGGFYSSTIDFGGGALTSPGGYDIFLAKFDSNGDHKWSKSFGGSNDDVAYSVAVDGNNNIYITGGFRSDKISFDNSTSYLNNYDTTGKSDIFIAQFRDDGIYSWGNKFGGDGDDLAYSIAIDSDSNIYLIGGFSSSSLSFGGNTLSNKRPGKSDIFIVKVGSNKQPIWSKSFGGEGDDAGISIIAHSKELYITGIFGPGNIVFDECPVKNSGLTDLTYDIFLVKHKP